MHCDSLLFPSGFENWNVPVQQRKVLWEKAMHIFTKEARSNLARMVGWTLSEGGNFVDYDGKIIDDVEAWKRFCCAIAQDELSASILGYLVFGELDPQQRIKGVRKADIQAITDHFFTRLCKGLSKLTKNQ